VFLSVADKIMAQRGLDSAGPGKVMIIKLADRYTYQDKDTMGKFVSLAGHAFVQQGKIKFYADSMVVNQRDNILEAYGNVHINDGDSVQIYSQYLKYLGREKKAFLNQQVKLTDGKGVLTTNQLEYRQILQRRQSSQ
jgi:lipopolysaccharide assembly outer membrane protein LptD (OstA)